MRTIARILAWVIAAFVIAAGAGLWWYVYRPLPQLDGSVLVPGLGREVTVERDRWGVPHIRAESLEDLCEAQGYVMAQDRLWQMDLLRRAARGQLAEILGKAALASDKQFRTLQLDRAADRDISLMEADPRRVVEAYARGVNRFIEQHQNNLPVEFSMLRYKPQPWQASDTLVIFAYMFKTLTNNWQRKLDRAKVLERVGPDRAKDLFSLDSNLDRFVVGDPDVANDGSNSKPADSGDDDDDDDEMEPDNVLKASVGKTAGGAVSAGVEQFPDIASALAPATMDFLSDTSREIRNTLGSNNWVVSGEHTATHKPLLANDPHLELTMPSIWYQIHLTAPGWNVKGVALPGTPLVTIGHNDRIAWGFTNNGADVQDLYKETFNPTTADEYRVKGGWAKAQVFDEVIHIKNEGDEHLRVTVTRHGPIVYCEDGVAYALRWTATEPGALAHTYAWIGNARNWDEFRNTMKVVWGPAQNTVYADVAGNIGYIMAARVPIRKKGHGEVPVPGDSDDYEWAGYIPFEQLPQAMNPESGFIGTANARVVGPNYKPYLTDSWAEPYRTARIYDLLLDKHDLRPADMLTVETDTYSFPDVFLSEQLIAAAKVSAPKDARVKTLIAQLKDWNGMADADSPLVTFLETTRQIALKLVLEPYLGEDTNLYQERRITFLQELLTKRPAKWLPAGYKSYDDLLMDAGDRATAQITEETKSSRVADWPWKRFNSLNMYHPLGHSGVREDFLSITNKPQSGTRFSIRAASKTHGPSMRFVANPANWDESILVMTAGESGQPGSSHYADQFSYWYAGKAITEPFSDKAEASARRHKLTLQPEQAALRGVSKTTGFAPEIVTFNSGKLTLRGFVYRPQGTGPFPAVLYNHGSAPGTLSNEAFEQIGPLFARHGWVFFAPYRRGQGLSESVGPYIGDEITASTKRGGISEGAAMMMRRLQMDQLDDQLAGLAWLRDQPYIEQKRIAAMGNSFGGIETVLAVARTDYCAGVDASGGGQSWAQSPELQNVLLQAVRNSKAPIFFYQAKNDYDLAPSIVLAKAMQDVGKVAVVKIYPPYGATPQDGHSFAYLGSSVWGADVFSFLDQYCAPTSK